MSEVGKLAAEVFAGSCPPETVRALMGDRAGYDRAMWRRWARETGLPGLAVPEEYGGGGFPTAALADVFEAAGAALVPAPLLSTTGMAIPLLLAMDDQAAAGRLPDICAGALTATVAVPDGEAVVRAVSTDGGWRLSGRVERVVDGATADLLLVVAEAPDGPGVFAVEAADGAGLERTTLMSLDLTRRLAAVTLAEAPAARVGEPGAGERIAGALDVTRALLAAELVGSAQRCLDMTVEYASRRVQFGRPIGSFQAVKQRAADMLNKVELARSAARHAAESAGPAPERAVAAALAKAYCAEAAVSVAADAVQLHGGIGFTWEHDVHLHFKRAIANDELLGPAAAQWARVAEHLDHAR